MALRQLAALLDGSQKIKAQAREWLQKLHGVAVVII
jgi:hypothetical protein